MLVVLLADIIRELWFARDAHSFLGLVRPYSSLEKLKTGITVVVIHRVMGIDFRLSWRGGCGGGYCSLLVRVASCGPGSG